MGQEQGSRKANDNAVVTKERFQYKEKEMSRGEKTLREQCRLHPTRNFLRGREKRDFRKSGGKTLLHLYEGLFQERGGNPGSLSNYQGQQHLSKGGSTRQV